MKQCFSKKTRLLIGLGAGLMSATAIVTPLATGCASTKTKNDVLGFDKQYNISNVTYTHLQDAIASEYEVKLQHEGKYTQSEIAKKVGEARESIKTFDTRAKSLRANLSYYQLTDSLIDFAKNQFGVDAEREFTETSINWTLENEKFKSSLKDSLRNALRIDEFSSSDSQKFLNNFETQFSRINTNLSDPKSKDFIKDPLKRFNQLKSESISCFDDINDELTQLSANVKMKNFNKGHSFSFSQTDIPTNNKVYFEDVRDTYKFKINQDISKFVEDNFQIFDHEAKTYSSFTLDNLISGYRIVPLFKGLNANAQTNQYSMKIDWLYVRADKFEKMHTKTGEIDMNVANSVASHSAMPNGPMTESHELTSIGKLSDFYKIDDKQKDFSTYELPIHVETELEGLQKEYLDKITFEWDTKGAPAADKYKYCKYEPFFGVHAKSIVGNATDQFTKLSTSDLAEIGLRLSEKGSSATNRKLHSERLDKLLNQFKISKLDKKKDSTVNPDGSSKTAEDYYLTAIENFVLNCDIKAHSTIIDDNKHDVANTLYISYKNSSFSDNEKWKMIGEEDAFHCTGMPISNEFYKVVNKQFNNVKLWADQLRDIDKKEFTAPLHNVIKPAWHVAIGICSIIMLISSISLLARIRSRGFKKTFTFDKGIIPEAKPFSVIDIIQKILCLIGGCIAIGSITAILTLGGMLWHHYETWKDAKKQMNSSSSYQKLMNRIDNDYETKFKNYNVFKNQPMHVIVDDLNFYKNFSSQPLYRDFIKDWIAFGLTANEIITKTLPQWVEKFNKIMSIVGLVVFIHMAMTIIAATAEGIALAICTKQLGMGICFCSNMELSFGRIIGRWGNGGKSSSWRWKLIKADFESNLKMNDKFWDSENKTWTSDGQLQIKNFDEYMAKSIKDGLSPKEAGYKRWTPDELEKFFSKDSNPAIDEAFNQEDIVPKVNEDIVNKIDSNAEKMPDANDFDDSAIGYRKRFDKSFDVYNTSGDMSYMSEPDDLPFFANQQIKFVKTSNDETVSGDDGFTLILYGVVSPVNMAATSSKWMRDYKMAGSFEWMLHKAEDFSYDENAFVFQE